MNDTISRRTPYIQEALIEVLAKQNLHIDEVHILLTPEAWQNNWVGEEKLLNLLQALKGEMNFTIHAHDIVSQQNIDTICNLFEVLVEIIQENDAIVFEITHSYRYQPMLALLAIHFARVTKNIQVVGIYYGLFSEQDKVNPIMDLTSFVELQDWIANVFVFTKTGRGDVLSELIKAKDSTIRKQERRSTIDLKAV